MPSRPVTPLVPAIAKPWASLGLSLLALGLAVWGVRMAQAGRLEAWAVFLLAGVALAFSSRGTGAPAWGWLGMPAQPRQAWEPVFVLLLLVLAWAFRFHDLYASPLGAHGHEGEMVSHTINHLARGKYTPHVGDGNILWPSLIFYQGLASKMLFGDAPEVWRYASSLWGVLAVLALYFTARLFCAPWVAAVAALLFNASQLNLAISRNFFPGSLLFVSVLGGFGLLVQGLRTGRAWMFFGGGFLAGLSLHGYVPGRPVPLLFALWLGWVWLWQRQATPKASRQLLFWLGLALCAGPVLWFMLTKWRLYWEYVDSMNPSSNKGLWQYLQTFMQNLKPYAHAPFFRGDVSAAEDVPLRPLFDPFSGGLVALGLGYAVALCWRPINAYVLALLTLGLGASVLGGGFAHPTGRRLMLVLPSLYLVSAFALERLRLNLRAWGPWAPGGLAVAALGLGAWANVRSWDHYFHGYSKDPTVLMQRAHRTALAGHEMRQSPQAQVLATPLVTGFVTTRMLMPWAPHQPFRHLTDLARLRGDADLLLLAEPWVDPLLPLLGSLAPQMEVRRYPHPGGPDHGGEKDLLLAIRIPADQVRGFFGMAGQGQRYEVFTRGLPRELAGQRVALEAALDVPDMGQELSVDFDVPGFGLWLDDRPLLHGKSLRVDGGLRRLRLEGRVPAGGLPPLPLKLTGPSGDLVAQRRVLAWAPTQGVAAEFRSEPEGPIQGRRLEVGLALFHHDITYLPVTFHARYKAWLTPDEGGEFGVRAAEGPGLEIRVDGRVVLRRRQGQPKQEAPLRLQAGRRYALEVDMEVCPTAECRALRLFLHRADGSFVPFPEAWLNPRP